MNILRRPGQTAGEVQFSTWGGGQQICLTRQGVLLTLPRKGQAQEPATANRPRSCDTVRLTPVGMRPGVELLPLAPQAGKFNYLMGNDPQKWRTNIPTYQAVLYREVYPGIDLKFCGNSRQLEYDVIIRPGADPGRVKFRYTGARKLAISPKGDLVITLPGGGELRQHRPVIYQEIDGRRVARPGSFKLARQGDAYGFALGGYDPRYPLVIDPVLTFSTYFGNLGWDHLRHIAVDDAGAVYLVGDTEDSHFPVTSHHLPIPAFGTRKVFVAKFTSGGSLAYSTLLGGSNSEYGYGIDVNGAGEAYVTGYTYSSDFPVTSGAYRTTYAQYSAFVTRLNAYGSGLIYSTFLGGSSLDSGSAIALDDQECAYVTGSSHSSDFPSRNPLFPYKNNSEAFVTKIDPTGSQWLFSTFLGGIADDYGSGLALDRCKNIYVAGTTNSDNFPTANAWQGTYTGGGNYILFLSKIRLTGGLAPGTSILLLE